MAVYKYYNTNKIKFKTNIYGVSFEDKYFKVLKNGEMIVRKGYAWDGCSVKFKLGEFGYIGTPDGVNDQETMKPMTYYASMLHDAIYQYKSEILISRKEADKLFLSVLNMFNWKYTKIYYKFVRIFGAFYGIWKLRKTAINKPEVTHIYEYQFNKYKLIKES